ncbi:MAG: GNAT family N-acetyltransferase [Prochloraceae cyanobacterium]|nr:GNAT family N-acetyltransferase [Prochloraceae cyanobacterium]
MTSNGSNTKSAMPGNGAIVTLREITRETVRTITDLEVSDRQKHFVTSNAVSIAQAYFDRERAWFRAIYADEIPIGFLMLDDDPVKEEYFLWRFMIDARFQGRGFGKRALELLIEHVKTRPGAKCLLTSCVPGKDSPCQFYEKMGFIFTRDLEEDSELLMCLDFRSQC